MIINSVIAGQGGGGKYTWAKYNTDVKLPAGYICLSSIASTGTQYINTGVTPSTGSFKVSMTFRAANPAGLGSLFGAEGSSTLGIIAHRVTGSDLGFYIGSSTEILTHTLEADKKYVLECSYANGTFTRTINGSTASQSVSPPYTSANIALFGHFTNSTISSLSAFELFECRIEKDGVLVRNFVPVEAPNGTVGLYDVVNSAFYSNAGSGSFTKGDKSGFTFIEYVSSDEEGEYPANGEHTDGYFYIAVADPYFAENDYSQIATGTATNSQYALTVTGLPFTPKKIALIRNGAAQTYITHTYNTTGYYYQSGAKTIAVTFSYTADGFTARAANKSEGSFYGTYYWIAWSE